MPRRRAILLTILVFLGCAALALSLVSWEGPWRSANGRADWQEIRLGADDFGLEPALYWSKSDRRLLVAPYVALAGVGNTEGERLFAYDPASRAGA
jgi:hypothetical protein